MMKHVNTLMFLAATLASGCAGDENSPDTLEFRTTFSCTECQIGGSNSAHVNLYPIDQLHLYGQTNADGVRLLGIESPLGDVYALRTEGDELIAWDPNTETTVAMGAALIGWDIQLLVVATSERLEAKIMGYDGAMPTVAQNGGTLSAYAIAYQDPTTGDWHSICPRAIVPAEDFQPDEIAVTVVRGELYDEQTKSVSAAPEWITLACFGQAVAKMKQLNYGPYQNFDGQGHPATIDQRQATIRMITADYCGDGTTFTVDGTPLAWKNASGTVEPANPAGDIEAVWTPSGAACLGTPRLANHEEVAERCELKPCTQQQIDATAWEWKTWTVD